MAKHMRMHVRAGQCYEDWVKGDDGHYERAFLTTPSELPGIQHNAMLYIRRAGRQPLVTQFDEDHDPIGPQLRTNLHVTGFIISEMSQDPTKYPPRVKLTKKGKAYVIAHYSED